VTDVWPLQEVCCDRCVAPSGGVTCGRFQRCVVTDVWPLREVCRDRCVASSGGVP